MHLRQSQVIGRIGRIEYQRKTQRGCIIPSDNQVRLSRSKTQPAAHKNNNKQVGQIQYLACWSGWAPYLGCPPAMYHRKHKNWWPNSMQAPFSGNVNAHNSPMIALGGQNGSKLAKNGPQTAQDYLKPCQTPGVVSVHNATRLL